MTSCQTPVSGKNKIWLTCDKLPVTGVGEELDAEDVALVVRRQLRQLGPCASRPQDHSLDRELYRSVVLVIKGVELKGSRVQLKTNLTHFKITY